MNSKKLVIILLLVIITTGRLLSQVALFNGQVMTNNGNIPAMYYPVYFMVNHDTLSCLEVETDETGFYSTEIQLSPGDEVVVKVYDCDGIEHTAEFPTPDSVNTANFTICFDNSNCQALFFAEPDTSNPLSIQFYNLSTGNYQNISWDFGDGSPTDITENPIHIYGQEGVYVVSLMIYDSLNTNGCFDIYTEMVNVGNPPQCHANFSYALDTLNNMPMVYNFTSLSEGDNLLHYWEFGDNSYSMEKNPQHIYEKGGSYTIYHMVQDSLSGCYADTIELLETPNYYDFGGQAFLGDFPINIDPDEHNNSATAYLFRKVNNRWYYVDQRSFWQLGYYWFTSKLEGDYLIRIDLDENSEASSQYAPGYYKHTEQWRQAPTFTLTTEVFEESINLVELSSLETGINSISGYLNYDSTYKGDREFMSGVLVQLYNQSKNLVKYTYSDETGNYVFDNLPDGTFYVRGEIPGICSNEPDVTLSADNGSVNELKVTLYDCGTVGIDENKEIASAISLSAFPVPADKKLNLKINSFNKGKVIISLVGMDGKKVLSRTINLSGEKLVSLNTSRLPNGIYLVNILGNSNKQLIEKKVIISH